jgi:hypothetical protein
MGQLGALSSPEPPMLALKHTEVLSQDGGALPWVFSVCQVLGFTCQPPCGYVALSVCYIRGTARTGEFKQFAENSWGPNRSK